MHCESFVPGFQGIVITLRDFIKIIHKIVHVNIFLFLQLFKGFNVGPPYWVGDWPVYGRIPVNVKSGKKTQEISQPKVYLAEGQNKKKGGSAQHCTALNTTTLKMCGLSFYVQHLKKLLM